MPIIDSKKLLKLPVETKSGAKLGRVAGFEFDCGGQAVLRWHVRPNGLTSRVLKKPLVVAREQVLSISDEKMVVDDNVEKEMEMAKAEAIGLVSNVEA